MSRQFYRTSEDALKSFIGHHLKAYIKIQQRADKDGRVFLQVALDTDKLFDDFHDELRSTLGELYYLDYEGE